MKLRGRLSTGLERQMFSMLVAEHSKGIITELDYQPAPLILAHKCTYTPDATCIRNGRREYWEAKNYWVKLKDDGGLVKLKVAAQMFQMAADFWLYEQTKSGEIKISKVKVIKVKTT